MEHDTKLSLLLLDDNADLLTLYKAQLEGIGPFKVTAETDGYRARSLAERQLFDLVVIDAKLDYKGIEFGGLRLADDLRSRYGSSSLLIISRFITEDLMREYGAACDFMEKGAGGGTHFCESLSQRLLTLRERQYVFVAMPFADEYLPFYNNEIKVAVEAAGYKCARVDKMPHNRGIQEVIFEMVERSKIVVFVADGANPNAYYEAGYADAMRKEVVIVCKSHSDLKFDVANRNTIAYDSKIENVKDKLAEKLIAMSATAPLGV